MLITFKDYLFNLLPPYFQVGDSYKNSSNEGLLQRYLSIFGLELDEELKNFIDNIMDILDVTKTPDKMVVLLSGNLGYMPSFGDLSIYRKLLAYAIEIYKVKGTIPSFEIIFNILGYSITIEEIQPPKKFRYDSNVLYDNDEDTVPPFYDSECAACTDYYIHIKPNIPNPDFTITPELTALATRVASFLQPIDAKFKGLIVTVPPKRAYSWYNTIGLLTHEMEGTQLDIWAQYPDDSFHAIATYTFQASDLNNPDAIAQHLIAAINSTTSTFGYSAELEPNGAASEVRILAPASFGAKVNGKLFELIYSDGSVVTLFNNG